MSIALPLLGGAYGARVKSVSPEECVNFYLEAHGEKTYLVGTPGLTLRVTLDEGPIRGLHRMGNNLFAVAGTRVYHISTTHVATLLGTIATFAGLVSMRDDGASVVLVDGSSMGWIITPSSLTLIADVDFEGGSNVTFQDGYFIVPVPLSGRFRISDLNSVTSWIDTDFATAEGAPDDILFAISDLRQLWLFGETTTEVWDNTGSDADFPFQRNPSGFLQKGTCAARSVCQFDNTLVWLSRDERGQALLLQATGYNTVVVSPQSINWQWSRYARVDDAFAYVYQMEGHEIYVITFPTGNATWCYNATTKQWHRWASNLSNVEWSRHRSNAHAFRNGMHYVGDYLNGKVYTLEPDVYTEAGAAIIRDRISGNVETLARVSLDELEIECQSGVGLVTGQGSDPQLMLRTSKDDGNSWGNEQWRSAGRAGEYSRRAVWRKQGRSRYRSFWLRASDPVKWVITGAVARSRDEAATSR